MRHLATGQGLQLRAVLTRPARPWEAAIGPGRAARYVDCPSQYRLRHGR
jgi:hypothetical protein